MKKIYCDRCGEAMQTEVNLYNSGDGITTLEYTFKTDNIDDLLNKNNDYCGDCKKIIKRKVLDALNDKKVELRVKEDYDMDSDDSHYTVDVTECYFHSQETTYKIKDYLIKDIKVLKYYYNDKGDNREESIEFIKGSNFKYNYPCSDGSLLIADKVYGREFVINPEDIIVKLKNDCVQIYDPKEFKSTFETETTSIR